MVLGTDPRDLVEVVHDRDEAEARVLRGADLDQQLVEQALRRGVVEGVGGAVETEPDRHAERMPPIPGARDGTGSRCR